MKKRKGKSSIKKKYFNFKFLKILFLGAAILLGVLAVQGKTLKLFSKAQTSNLIKNQSQISCESVIVKPNLGSQSQCQVGNTYKYADISCDGGKHYYNALAPFGQNCMTLAQWQKHAEVQCGCVKCNDRMPALSQLGKEYQIKQDCERECSSSPNKECRFLLKSGFNSRYNPYYCIEKACKGGDYMFIHGSGEVPQLELARNVPTGCSFNNSITPCEGKFPSFLCKYLLDSSSQKIGLEAHYLGEESEHYGLGARIGYDCMCPRPYTTTVVSAPHKVKTYETLCKNGAWNDKSFMMFSQAMQCRFDDPQGCVVSIVPTPTGEGVSCRYAREQGNPIRSEDIVEFASENECEQKKSLSWSCRYRLPIDKEFDEKRYAIRPMCSISGISIVELNSPPPPHYHNMTYVESNSSCPARSNSDCPTGFDCQTNPANRSVVITNVSRNDNPELEWTIGDNCPCQDVDQHSYDLFVAKYCNKSDTSYLSRNVPLTLEVGQSAICDIDTLKCKIQ